MYSEDVSMLVKYPAAKKLFEVREYSEQLSEKKGEFFHLAVAKLLFIMKKSRHGLETSVGFLMTRVSNSDVDDR